MSYGESVGAASATIVELKRPRGTRPVPVELAAGACVSIGSARPSQVVLEDAGVLPRHATLRWDDQGLWIEPLDGAPIKLNGRLLDGPARLGEGDWLLLGSTPYAVTLRGGPETTAPAARTAPSGAGARTLTVGRLAECDVCIDSPVVSRQHARLVVEPGAGCFLEDLGSTNGTFVDGQRVQGRTALAPGSRVQFASFAYLFDGVALRQAESAGRVRLVARGLGKTVIDTATRRPRALLRDVNLAIEPGEFAIVFGTSGSGKSTLVDALSGRRPASEGSVLYNDLDLYGHFDVFRAAVGYVPQQDIVHRRITVGRALAYTARLRLPEDTSEREIEGYVARVLERVGLPDKADVPIDTPAPLSGGQLKRVSVAVELISNPALLFLDEATSGLDAATDKRMMRLFADLAADGKTVVCVTHTLENVDVCDLVVLMHRGFLVYVGPPDGALDHFEVKRLPEVYEKLEASEPEGWAERFAASAHHENFVGSRLHRPAGDTSALAPAAAAEVTLKRPRNALRQAVILTRRYVDLILADQRNLAILLLQAPLIGLVIGLVFELGEGAQRATAESQVSFMLVVSAIWFGCLNSAREIVKELPIWRRERAVNLEPLPYLASKLGPLAAISALQVAGLVAATTLLLDLSGSAWAQACVLWLASLAATAMGLLVSALVTSSDKAVATVPVLLIPQVILSGAIVALGGAVEWVAKTTMISYWAFDAMKNLMGESVRNTVGPTGAALVRTESGLRGDLGAMAALLGVFLFAAWLALRRGEAR
jgi:ABC-type multidrug transport system ATPase subunit